MVLMDFSGVYEEQEFWKEKRNGKEENIFILNLRNLSGCSCYCDGEAAAFLRKQISPLPVRDIHFLDSGNYHYMSRLWMEKAENPFQLAVLDHHTDMQPPVFGGLLSCGGWVASSAEELSLLQSVLLIGPPSEDFLALPEAAREKASLFGMEDLETENWKRKLHCFLEKELQPGLPLYLSLDKDLLSEQVLQTNWGQGTMGKEQLFSILEEILAMASVLGISLAGVDICGENDANAPVSRDAGDELNGELLSYFRRFL
ncbi:MAG: arginase [Blautia sp.]|nr:arginase [Blautia sp.]